MSSIKFTLQILLVALCLVLTTTTGYTQSQLTNLPTLWITTTNSTPITSKSTWVTGHLNTFANGMPGAYEGEIEIRGRGNSTWRMDKKPYRLRLKQKFNLLGLPARERNWVLLANYADKSLLRNAITFDISQFMGLPFSCHYQLVDVYVNGEYQGNYTLTDQVQVADTRINLEELEPTDTTLPTISGGYLLEIDGLAIYEPVYFHTSRGVAITVKSPDEETINSQQLNYIRDHINKLEEALFSDNYKDPVNGYRKYVDMNSLVNWYIGCELSANPDSFWSTYIFKRRGDEKIYFGPLWDYDIAYNNDNRINKTPYRHMSEVGFGYSQWIRRLLMDDNFRIAVRDRWNELKNRGFKNHILNILDQRISQIDASQKKNFERWDILNRVVYSEPAARGSYTSEANFLREFIEHRFDWLDTEFNGVNPNYFYKITHRQSGRSLTFSQKNIVEKTYQPNDNFHWQLVPLSNLTFQLINKGTNQVLEGSIDNRQLELKENNPTLPGQQWIFSQVDHNIYRITNTKGYSIDNSGGFLGENNPVVQHGKSTYNTNQEWELSPVESIAYENCRAQLTITSTPSQPVCNNTVTLTSQCEGPNCGEYSYEWSGYGIQTTGTTLQVTHTMPGTYVYAISGKKQGCSNIYKTYTVEVPACTSQQEFTACVEAENSVGNGPITDDSNASNGKTRGSRSSTPEYVEYSISNVPVAGIYHLTLRYSSERQGDILITNNFNNSKSRLPLPPSNSWNIVFNEYSVPVYLQQGTNVIKIESVGDASIRQDKICVKGKVGNQDPVPQPNNCNFTISAQSDRQSYECQAPVQLSANCTGSDCSNLTYQWSGHGLTSTGSTATITPSTAGNYTYNVTVSKPGCTPQTKTVSIVVNACSSTPPPGGSAISFTTCLEAENETGSAGITDDPNASGGKTRGNQNATNQYVTYTITNVPQDGQYNFTLRYAAEYDAAIIVSNQTNSTSSAVNLPRTSSWNIVFFEKQFSVALKQGTNQVRIESTGMVNVRQDKLCINGGTTSGAPGSTCNFAITASSDKTTYACNTPVTLQAQCQGGDCNGVTYQWSGNGLNSTQAQVTLTPAQPGNYTYTLVASKNGCESITKTVNITIQECTPTVTCNFTITASSNKTTYACNTPVTLQAQCQGGDCSGVTYQWSGNGLNSTQAQVTLIPAQPGNYTYTLVASKNGCESVTKTVHITVEPCAPVGETISFSQCIEAENSTGTAPISSDPNASNGQTRGDASRTNLYVDYAVNNVPYTGNVELKIRYSSSQASQIQIFVNGNTIKTVPLSPTHSWNIVFNEATVTIPLQAGNNVIRIQDIGENSTRQDRICLNGTLSGDSGSNPTPPSCSFAITANATKSTYTCNETISLQATCTGNDCGSVTYQWAGNQTSYTGRQITPTNLQPGNYTFRVTASKQGCSDLVKNVTFTVNACENSNPPVDFTACLESEQMSGTGAITDDPNASTGRTRGTVDNPQHEVNYVIQNVPQAGMYRVTLRYAAEHTSQVLVTINDTQQTETLAATYSWNIVFNEKTFHVPLKAGTNMLQIKGIGSVSTRQDKLCIQSTAEHPSARMGGENYISNAPLYKSAESQGTSLALHPNPAKEKVHVTFFAHKNEKATLTIYDVLGKIIHRQEVQGNGLLEKTTIPLLNTAPGMYLLRLSSPSYQQTQKFIILP